MNNKHMLVILESTIANLQTLLKMWQDENKQSEPIPAPESTPEPTPEPEPEPEPISQPDPPVQASQPIIPEGDTEIDVLKAFLPQWPVAVDPLLICQADEVLERQERAEQILDAIVEEPLVRKSFLDFGCGSGETVDAALKRGARSAMGYDVVPFTSPNPNFTHEFSQLEARGPFDVVLLYDVLDHIVNEEPVQVLQKLKSILSPDGTMYLRCHPWVSKHGGHLYKQLNKEYAHLLFTETELREMGYTLEPVRKIFYPCMTYQKMFRQAGLKVVKELVISDNIPQQSYLRLSPFVNRINRSWDKKINKFPEVQLSMSFVDYVVKAE